MSDENFRLLCAVLEVGASGRRQLTASVAEQALNELTRLRAQRDKAVEALREIIREYPLASGTMKGLGSDWPKDGYGSIGRARATLAEIGGELYEQG